MDHDTTDDTIAELLHVISTDLAGERPGRMDRLRRYVPRLATELLAARRTARELTATCAGLHAQIRAQGATPAESSVQRRPSALSAYASARTRRPDGTFARVTEIQAPERKRGAR